MYRFRVWLLIALIAPATLARAAQAPIMTLADLDNQVRVDEPAISPDGQRIVVVTTRADFVDNHFVRSMFLIDAKTGAQRPIAASRAQVASPQWSPQGDRLAYIDFEDRSPGQIYVVSLNGEPEITTRITAVPQGVQDFRWSPDGTSFAFISEDPPTPRAGDERHNRSFEVNENDYLARAAAVPSHLWMISATGGAPHRLTSGEESVTDIEWVSGGEAIAFISKAGADVSQRRSKALKIIDVRSGAQRVLVPNPTFFADTARTLLSSPDGRLIAYRYYPGPEVQYRPVVVAVVPVAGGTPRDLTRSLDRSMMVHAWTPDGKALVVAGPDRTRFNAWLQPLEGAARRLDLGPVITGISFFSPPVVSRTGAVAFIGDEPHRPQELYYMASTQAAPRRLTGFNDARAALNLGRVESIRWKGPDGFDEDGVLFYPPGFARGRKAPLVLNIHGGPMGTSVTAWQDGFSHLLAAQGWIVFCPNYRGSNSMGEAFQLAIVNNAGDGPGRDVMAGVEAVKALGVVDESRIAVSGFSYGGYMTAWLTGQYSIWRAAVAAAAVTDWTDYYDLGDFNVWVANGLGGSPWLGDSALANYWRQSPMAYAHRIRTPMLILAGAGDRRVPITQSYKLYHALKDNGVPVKFVVYPVDAHEPADPVHLRDFHRRWIEWIEERFRQ